MDMKQIFDKLTDEEQAALRRHIAIQISRERARLAMEQYSQRSQQPLPRPFEVLNLNDIYRPQDCCAGPHCRP